MSHIKYEVEVKNLPGELRSKETLAVQSGLFCFLGAVCQRGGILVRVERWVFFITMVWVEISFYECENQSVPLVDFSMWRFRFLKSKGVRPYLPLTPYHD